MALDMNPQFSGVRKRQEIPNERLYPLANTQASPANRVAHAVWAYGEFGLHQPVQLALHTGRLESGASQQWIAKILFLKQPSNKKEDF
jgi:hypothetical protein